VKTLLAFLLVLSLLVVTGTLVSADGQTLGFKQTDSRKYSQETMEAN
jgi:hypothetical protein